MATETVDIVVGPVGAGVVAEVIGGEVVGVGVVAIESGQEEEVEAHVVGAVLGGNDEAFGVLECDRHVEVVLGVETGQPHHGGEVVDRLGVEVAISSTQLMILLLPFKCLTYIREILLVALAITRT